MLAIFEGMALIKFDRDSKVLWTYAAGCHHDLSVTPAGQIYVLTSETRDGIIDNGIALLDEKGRELNNLSLLDCLRASPYASLQAWLPKHGDVLHANAVKLLDGRHADKVPAFADGNLLVSILELNTIAVVDPEAKTIPWALTGLTKAQHEPTLLANGNLLVFDNRGGGRLVARVGNQSIHTGDRVAIPADRRPKVLLGMVRLGAAPAEWEYPYHRNRQRARLRDHTGWPRRLGVCQSPPIRRKRRAHGRGALRGGAPGPGLCCLLAWDRGEIDVLAWGRCARLVE